MQSSPCSWKPQDRHLRARAEVAKAFGYTVADLTGRSQLSIVARARFAGFWVVKQRWPELSFRQIGVMFGGRASTGVRHGFDRAVDYRQRDDAFRQATDRLTQGYELWEPAGPSYLDVDARRAARASVAVARRATFPRATRARNDFETDAPVQERLECRSVRDGSRRLLAAMQREGFA